LCAAYLVILPKLTTLFIPCLGNHPFASYTSDACTVELVLDTFMRLAIGGLVVLTLGFLLTMRRYLKLAPFHTFEEWKKIPPKKIILQEFAPVIIVSLIMAILIGIAYVWYIPSVEQHVRNAAIILDTISKP